MKKIKWSLLILLVFACGAADAQFGYGRVRMGGRMRMGGRSKQQQRPNLPKFDPSVNISIGYGFPNLDKSELAGFYGAYKGSASQTGPFMGSIDYQFSRFMSIGIMATHGKVSAPYYNYGSTTPAFTGNLDNWSVMLNIVRYIPGGKVVSPYLRTAIGVNIWNEDYADVSGNKVAVAGDPFPLAYQASLGAKFNLSKSAGLFVEAGYGKYILNGGLSFKFK
jgi:hypothetical protein